MIASEAYSFYDKAKHKLSSTFNHVKNDLRQVASKAKSSASSKTGSKTAGDISTMTLDYKTHEQRIAEIMRRIKDGKLIVDNKKSSPFDIKMALQSGKYAGLDTEQMIDELKKDGKLKAEPKPKPSEPKPSLAQRPRPKLLTPAFAAA